MNESAVAGFRYVVVRNMRRTKLPPILEQPQRRLTFIIRQKMAGYTDCE
jgi:hypothetical protein